jgi:hypothetical protein
LKTVSLVAIALASHLKTTLGVKERVVNLIDVKALVVTLFITGTLSRDDTFLKGYHLANYKLDVRLKPLVMPRGVYLSESKLAKNVLKFDMNPDDAKLVLTPAKFEEVQSEMFGAMRSKIGATMTLEEASSSIGLVEATDRATVDGYCQYLDGVPYLPLELSIGGLIKDHAFNTPMEEMVTLLMADVVKAFK